MELKKLDMDFTVCKIQNINSVDFSKEFVFLSKTGEEISLVCESSLVPENAIAIEAGWNAFKIAGVLEFGCVGVIAKIADILSKAGISIFVVSTYNTDYVFIKSYDYGKGIDLLVKHGYTFRGCRQ